MESVCLWPGHYWAHRGPATPPHPPLAPPPYSSLFLVGQKWKPLGSKRSIWATSAPQKIPKLSESAATAPMVAKLCFVNSEKRKITKKLVQPVTPCRRPYGWGYSWGNIQKTILGHNFWLECPTDLRSTPLSYIFHALFRDTPLGHVHCTQSNIQIPKYPNIWLIWLFGYLAARSYIPIVNLKVAAVIQFWSKWSNFLGKVLDIIDPKHTK